MEVTAADGAMIGPAHHSASPIRHNFLAGTDRLEQHALRSAAVRSEAIVDTAPPRTLMLGSGWFPEQIGGLERYYRGLIEHMPEASGILIGQNARTPDRVLGVSGHDRPLPLRLVAFWRAAQRAAAVTDVVDAHFALYASVPLLLGRLRHKPLMLHFHGPWADESIAAGDRAVLRVAARRALERATYSRADAAVVLTSAFRQVLVERYRVQPWQIEVEPPGVDLDRFTPGSVGTARRRLNLEPGAFVAVAVRRLVPRMGLELLLEAWHDVVSGLPPGSTLLIAGDGPLLGTLMQAVATYGLADSVRLLGRVSDERLVDLYRAADIAVVPSLMHEGFGLAALEAAACGTPSLVTDVGGLPEAVAGLDESLILPPGDRVALREGLLRARATRPSRAAARAHAERYRWSAVAERHRRIADRITTRSRATSRLKVVYLDHVARLSGGEIALLRLLPHLDGVQPHVVLAEDGPLVGRLHRAGISTEVLPLQASARDLRKAALHPRCVPAEVAWATAGYVLRLAARLRRLQPDIVHTNSLKAGVYGSLAAKLCGIPMVWHVRDRIAEDYLPRSAVTLVRSMSRYFATAVLANSHSTMDTLAPPRATDVIYSVLPEVLTGITLHARPVGRPLTFGMVGRLAAWKGQDVFLRAFAQAFPHGEERAVIVGGALFGEDDYADDLVALAQTLGLSERVDFRGHRPDVWRELSTIDVLVHASVIPEPFGQVIIEGMAAGVPVIAARAGGPAEIVRPEASGLLYEPGDVGALAQAMRRMRDPRQRERLCAGARAGLDRYSPDVVAGELQQIYARVATRAGRAR